MAQQSIDACIDEWLSQFTPNREDSKLVRNLASILFFASLATEEKTPTRVSILLSPDGVRPEDILDTDPYQDQELGPEHAWRVIAIEPRPLDVHNLVKAAPLAEFGRSVVVVENQVGELQITGVARRNRRTDGGECLVLSAPSPGVVEITYQSIEIFRYERGVTTPCLPPILEKTGLARSAIMKLGEPLTKRLKLPIVNSLYTRTANSLIKLISSIQHGGLVLFLNGPLRLDDAGRVKLKLKDTGLLAEAMVNDNTSWGLHFSSVLVGAMRSVNQEPTLHTDTDSESSLTLGAKAKLREASLELDDILIDIARFSAVDNALLIGPGFEVIGAQFEVPSENAPMVYMATDLQGTRGKGYDLRRHGSRHRAAACFAFRYPGSLAVAISADGPIRCFLKRAQDEFVLMWELRLPAL